MPQNDAAVLGEDWNVLVSLFPRNWKELAEQCGALKGLRQDKSAETYLRLLLMHVGCGFSLRETVVRAREAGLADLSDVALLKRLRKSGPWLRELCRGLFKEQSGTQGQEVDAPPHTLRLIDATVVLEPGPTGSRWKLHYSFQWPHLECDFLSVTPVHGKDTGETLRQHPMAAGDYVVADRGYCQAQGFHYAASRGALFAVRLNPDGIRLENLDGTPFNLPVKLNEIKNVGDLAQWDVSIPLEGHSALPARLCVIQKSQAATDKSRRKLKKQSVKRGSKLKPQTLVYAQYVMVLTTFPRETYNAKRILETYRFRWQIEILFKRLKQLAKLGHLPKHDDPGAQAWLHGKLFVALLNQSLIAHADSFSPWGYRIEKTSKT
jgi:hypothetical protein